MQSFVIKPNIYFGDNAISRLAEIEYKKVFIIADPFTVSSGLIKSATKYLDAANINYTVYSDVVPDPSIEKVVEGVTALLKVKAPCIIAVGGGSAIDLSKCVRQFANKIDSDYFPHFIAIPTTSGTGSEVTSFSVITDREKNIKHAIVDNSLLPEEAILDVEMVKSVPASITADTGMDVMTHAIEAYVSTNANSISDMYAERATQLCKNYLVRSFKYSDTHDIESREKMHLASNLAGIAFNSASLGINHGMAHQLGAQFHIPHGRANAILLPVIIAYNCGIDKYTNNLSNPSYCVKKYADMARVIGIGNFNDVSSVKSLIDYIKHMQLEMNIPSHVSAAVPKLKKDEYFSKIETMTAAALKDRCTPTNPRTPTPEEISELFAKLW